jgi:hypothetical protein
MAETWDKSAMAHFKVLFRHLSGWTENSCEKYSIMSLSLTWITAMYLLIAYISKKIMLIVVTSY